MSIYEAIGICWVVLTSSLATIGILYGAYCSFKHAVLAPVMKDVPVELKGGHTMSVRVPTHLHSN